MKAGTWSITPTELDTITKIDKYDTSSGSFYNDK